ncbi:MAG: hypothetical protein ACK4L7_00030 [Flavobacteriales bacterium]
MSDSGPIDTKAATVARTGDRLVEVRFKPQVKLDADVLGEVVRAKQALCAMADSDILVVLPAELDFELSALSLDHREAAGGCGRSKRLAVAASSPFNERLAGIYFRYHPRPEETAIFSDEADARRWLTECLAQPPRS